MEPCKVCQLPHPKRIPCSVWIEAQKTMATVVPPKTQSEKMKAYWAKRKAV